MMDQNKPLKANKSCLCASSHSSFALEIKFSNNLSIVRVLKKKAQYYVWKATLHSF